MDNLSVPKMERSMHTNQVAHHTGAYPGFGNMKRPGIFLLPPGWDASPTECYLPALSSPVLLDNAIHRTNRCPVDKCQQNKPRYPMDCDLFGG